LHHAQHPKVAHAAKHAPKAKLQTQVVDRRSIHLTPAKRF
jgi:hypothetical protein